MPRAMGPLRPVAMAVRTSTATTIGKKRLMHLETCTTQSNGFFGEADDLRIVARVGLVEDVAPEQSCNLTDRTDWIIRRDLAQLRKYFIGTGVVS